MIERTELMEQILTNELAQRIIDMVSPVYGNSYVGLWIFEAIGEVLSVTANFPEDLRNQVCIQTATWSLDLWEEQYGIVPDPTFTYQQRRDNILGYLLSEGKVTPYALEMLVSGFTGLETEVLENVSKNKFKVIIRGYVRDLTPIYKAINTWKQSHLIYELVTSELEETTMNTYQAVGMSEYEQYEVEVLN